MRAANRLLDLNQGGVDRFERFYEIALDLAVFLEVEDVPPHGAEEQPVHLAAEESYVGEIRRRYAKLLEPEGHEAESAGRRARELAAYGNVHPGEPRLVVDVV